MIGFPNPTATLTVDDRRFEIVRNAQGQSILKLQSGVALDYEQASSIPIQITATNRGGHREIQNFTIAVGDEDETSTNPPTYAIAVTPASVSEDGAGLLTYTVTRTGALGAASTITYSLSGTVDASDYTQSGTGTLSFAAGVSTASFTADPTSDAGFEFNETVVATLGSASDGGTITGASATGTILNDEPITRVNVSSTEAEALPSGYAPFLGGSDAHTSHSISADGRYVTFFSNSPNLVEGDTNNLRDTFVRDLLLGTTTRVSVNSAGEQGTTSGSTPWMVSTQYAPSISADGRYITFYSEADNLVPNDTNGQFDVFVRDQQAGVTTRVSLDMAGNAPGSSSDPSISADGRLVTFASWSPLSPTDTNITVDVYVRDLLAGTTERVSVDCGSRRLAHPKRGPATAPASV